MSHRRYNPLVDEWVLCSEGRLDRPWQGERGAVAEKAPPPYEPGCYICPGNVRGGGATNPSYPGVFLFDNDYPALAEGDVPGDDSELFVAEPATGRCRVLSFSPRHDAHLGTLPAAAVRAVVDAWAGETADFYRSGARYVQVFENRGAMMGASNPHPHGQVWSVDYVPTIPSRKRATQSAYASRHEGDLLGDYLDAEIARGMRTVEVREHWAQLVPFWAVWPFETLLIPRRRVTMLSELVDAERDELASMLGSLVRRYDRLFEVSFPYSMGWYQSPSGEGLWSGSRLHAVYLPPLLRSVSIRKYLVGYELTAEPQRDLTPEEAAERLRA